MSSPSFPLSAGRKNGDILVIVCNFTPIAYSDYRIGVPKEGTYREILNSDADIYGGSGWVNKGTLKSEKILYHGKPYSLTMKVPPFGISILRPVKKKKEKGEEREMARKRCVAMLLAGGQGAGSIH